MLNLDRPELIATTSYINGCWPPAPESMAVTNPANGERIARIGNYGAVATREAIDAASAAMPAWAAKPAKERANMLRNWFNLIMVNQKDLARILTAEQGKPLAEAQAEITYGAAYIEWFAEQAKRIDGDIIPAPNAEQRILVIKQPVGVVAAITPWNFPNAMISRKAAAALAAGCTFVGKPASETPLSALALCVLAEEAGIPPGVFNIVVGTRSSDIGKEMTSNPKVRKLTFTGSTQVGKTLQEQCAGTLKKTSLELGGNAPFIVFDDADLDAAIEGLLASKYRNSGQTCVCSNRILVQDGIYDGFIDKLSRKLADFRLGNGAEEGVTLGPLINDDAASHVAALVDDAIGHGAEVVTGGQASPLGSRFYEPTVLKHATSAMRVFREEIFGPVAPIFKFQSEEDAVAMANDTEFGLAAYFYTRDLGRIFRVGEALEYGMVGINEGIISNEMAPFGGIKESGTGREGSQYGIEDYLEMKYLCLGGLST